MLVKAKIEINYNVDEGQWKGVIYMYLPAKKEEGYVYPQLVPELRNPHERVLGYRLIKNIGINHVDGTYILLRKSENGEYRKIWESYRYDAHMTLEVILEELEGKLKGEVEKIKDVYEKNLERMKKSVQKHYEFNF